MKDINKIRLVAIISGFISMELELLGTRVISPIFGSTIYVWTSLIGITLAFLALGYWYGGKLADKGKINLSKLGIIVFLLGIYICLFPFISKIILYQFNSLGIILGPLSAAFVILAFPVFFLGFVVPTSVKLATADMGEVGGRAGEIYSLATAGSVIGTFTTGFYLILYLGIIKTALMTGVILILLSLIIIKQRKIFYLFLAIPLLLFFAAQTPATGSSSIYCDSGYFSEIKVTNEIFGEYNVRQLIMGNAIQTIKTDDPNFFNYINFFRVPFYFRNISSVAMIGLGGGEGIKMLHNEYGVQIDVIESDPKMKFVAEKYFGLNISDFNIIINDARNYFLTAGKKYDLIVSDTAFVDWNPYIFTKEFYELIKAHLSDDGVFMVNVIAPKEGEDSILSKSVYSDLKKEFGDVLIFRNPLTPDDEIDNNFFLASKGKILDKPLVLDEQVFIDSIVQKSFFYNETQDFENTDDMAYIEKYGLKMRERYFNNNRDEITRSNNQIFGC